MYANNGREHMAAVETCGTWNVFWWLVRFTSANGAHHIFPHPPYPVSNLSIILRKGIKMNWRLECSFLFTANSEVVTDYTILLVMRCLCRHSSVVCHLDGLAAREFKAAFKEQKQMVHGNSQHLWNFTHLLNSSDASELTAHHILPHPPHPATKIKDSYFHVNKITADQIHRQLAVILQPPAN